MNWKDKAKDVDLFFCVNQDCNVITFRDPHWNQCPKCHMPGSIVRHAHILPLGIRNADQPTF